MAVMKPFLFLFNYHPTQKCYRISLKYLAQTLIMFYHYGAHAVLRLPLLRHPANFKIVLSVAGHCRSSVIQYKRYTKKFIVVHFKKIYLRFSYNKRFSTIIKFLEPNCNFLMTIKRGV